MADDKKTDAPETQADETKNEATEASSGKPSDGDGVADAAPVSEAKVEEAKTELEAAPPVTKEEPAVADTPSEAAANQSAAQGAEGRPQQRGGQRGGGRGGNDRGRGRGGRDNRRGGRREEDDDGIIEKLVHINRVSKTVKGGKRFGFAALVVVGDGQGRVGFGKGKAREVPEAISKATAAARKKMVRVSLKEGRTLHHDGNGRFGAGKVTLRTAPPGTGIIAGGPMRAVFESLGVSDVVTKSVGTSNPYNMIRATFDALTSQTSPKSVAQRRGKKVADLLGRGGASEAEAEADAAAVVE